MNKYRKKVRPKTYSAPIVEAARAQFVLEHSEKKKSGHVLETQKPGKPGKPITTGIIHSVVHCYLGNRIVVGHTPPLRITDKQTKNKKLNSRGTMKTIALLLISLCGISYAWNLQFRTRLPTIHRLQATQRSAADTEGLLLKCERKLPGRISLVGAGPGSPDLLTVKAVRFLKEADLVISDRLVSKEILDMITCELRIARKRPGCAEEAQEEIYEWTKEAVLAGRDVVRLKIGDPFLFGRGGEEILEFRKLGVEPIVVPGVSSSYAAPMAANIPLTHRGVSNSVLISTGYGKAEAVIELPEYVSDRTVVLLMAVGRIGEIAANMTAMGYPKDTPVAIVERATTPEERTLTGTLATIAYVAQRDGAKAPATIVIGEVVNVLRGGSDRAIDEDLQLTTNQIQPQNENMLVAAVAASESNKELPSRFGSLPTTSIGKSVGSTQI